MKSFKNHISLVVALLSILFSLQTFVVVDRAIEAYKKNLATNYSLVIVCSQTVKKDILIEKNPLISEINEITPDGVIKKLNANMTQKNVELLKLTLPKFYKLKLMHYPSPSEIERVTKNLLKNKAVTKVESFSQTHDTTYKLLLLFKNVITVFALCVAIVTVLLISKELKIWQFKHNERMSIMGLFGAPTWLRSAVLFRLAIVDALIATLFAFMMFSYMASSEWIIQQFSYIGIEVMVFDKLFDSLIMLSVSITLSILLATFIVLGHKEEV